MTDGEAGVEKGLHVAQGVRDREPTAKKLSGDSVSWGKEGMLIPGLRGPNICSIIPSIFFKYIQFKDKVTKNFKMVTTEYFSLCNQS